MSHSSSICQTCGACCASFRVSFYWAEADDGGGTVPVSITEQVNSFQRCMRGTWAAQPHCVALVGEVGRNVGCAIYPLRSSTCRAVAVGSAQCLRARERWRLPALPACAPITG
ncbi:YkgJ family cysteine cluster protein [Vogesella oryzae]|uniref:YkgJ family cysteine cluster protein n=1 Tax=Vogesella oryzae TaxID=1735285 RepID=UPI0015815DD1|nr:YkgJ family cysteine cluster protein [Vogesella oryzae]